LLLNHHLSLQRRRFLTKNPKLVNFAQIQGRQESR
jgi:hypothetical protein